jgi:hypothetical protein
VGMDDPSIIVHDESASSTDFCQLMISSTDIPLDGCRSEYISSMQGGVAITMILQNVCRETVSARNFYDQTRGPYFGEDDSDFFQPFNFNGFMTDKNMPPINSRGEVPLEKIIKHVVATIRVSSVSMIPMQDVGVGVSVTKVGEKWLMIKSRLAVERKESGPRPLILVLNHRPNHSNISKLSIANMTRKAFIRKKYYARNNSP